MSATVHKPKRTIAAQVKPVENMEQLNAHMRALGEFLADREMRMHAMQARIQQIQAEAKGKIEGIEKNIFSNAKAIFPYVNRNREALTPEQRKSVELIFGSLQWYAEPRSISLEKGKAETTIKELKRLKLEQYIRTTEEVDLQAMTADLENLEKLNIAGISITGGREFFSIRPNASQTYVRHRPSTNAWTIEAPSKRKEEKTPKEKKA